MVILYGMFQELYKKHLYFIKSYNFKYYKKELFYLKDENYLLNDYAFYIHLNYFK